MSKTMTIEHNDVQYTLEFTRRTVAEMERKGFVAEDILVKPMLNLPALFEGAFLANHRTVKREVIDELFSSIPDKEEFLGALVEMYNEPLTTLLEEPKKSTKNAKWTMNW